MQRIVTKCDLLVFLCLDFRETSTMIQEHDFDKECFFEMPRLYLTLVMQLQLRKTKPVTPTKRPPPAPLPSQSSKKVKEEPMEWYSSDQYRMHEKQWYDNADEWEGVEEEPCQAPVQVKTEDDASSGKGEWKGKSSAPASGSKGKGKQSGHRSGWFNKMAILLARMQRGERKEVKLLTTTQLDWRRSDQNIFGMFHVVFMQPPKRQAVCNVKLHLLWQSLLSGTARMKKWVKSLS